ncbi:MAG: hypothetical protein IPM86_10515 [Saprospiraceae bacterium]|nr:hypothetical protein [Saprospiraceae bacterium]
MIESVSQIMLLGIAGTIEKLIKSLVLVCKHSLFLTNELIMVQCLDFEDELIQNR